MIRVDAINPQLQCFLRSVGRLVMSKFTSFFEKNMVYADAKPEEQERIRKEEQLVRS